MAYLKRIGIGRTAETFINDGGRALKLFYDFMPEEAARYEFSVSKKVAEVCDLAPVVYALKHREGRMGIEYELINGRMLVDLFPSHPLRIKVLARRMAVLHRAIHGCSLCTVRSATDVYEKSIKDYPDISDKARSVLLRFLEQSNGSVLCHGDFHPENILVGNTGNYKVIDWITAFYGDPLADVARSLYLMQSGKSPEKKPLLLRLAEAVFRRVIAKEYLQAYFQNSSIPENKLRIWDTIIRIHRYDEDIPEEREDLRRTIKSSLKNLF
jgi:tRNA A-37 threonylcarbamoyl transferase component Bud32